MPVPVSKARQRSPFFARLDSESIRIFLSKYDAYTRELKARASQLVQEGSQSLEPIRPVFLVYCVDSEQVESAVELDMTEGYTDVKDLSDDQLRTYLENEAVDSSTIVTATYLQMVQKHVRMDMTIKSAKERMKLLFTAYKSLLRQNGMSWVTSKNPKAAIRQVISVVKPVQLKTRLEQDIAFSKADLKDDFPGFMKHVLELSEAFEKLDNGNPRSRQTEKDGTKDQKDNSASKSSSSFKSAGSSKRSKGNKKGPPSAFPLPPCDCKDRMHWADDCPHVSEAEKKAFQDRVATSKARDVPHSSTRSQKSSTGDAASSSSRSVNRLRQDSKEYDDTPSCIITLSDVVNQLETKGRCDDGSDENIASPQVAERVAIMGIGKIESIKTVILEVALTKKDTTPHCYEFSRSWSVPATVLDLNSGRLVLKNVRYLVPDYATPTEDLLIGRPVLRHLRVDTKTLLEDRIKSLDGTDCSPNRLPVDGGHVSRLMVARLNRISNDQMDMTTGPPDPSRPKVNYFSARAEEDPIPDPSLLDPVDEDQHADIKTAVADMQEVTHKNCLPDEKLQSLAKLCADSIDIFCTSFSSGPPARIPPLKIELIRDAKTVKVRLRKYTQDKRAFLSDFVDKLVRHGLAYANPTFKWACAPLLVPKPGAWYRFTFDLRPVCKYILRYQYPMPILEHELTKLTGSKYFASFDFSHGYWKLCLSKESEECQSFITPDGMYTRRVCCTVQRTPSHTCSRPLRPSFLKT